MPPGKTYIALKTALCTPRNQGGFRSFRFRRNRMSASSKMKWVGISFLFCCAIGFVAPNIVRGQAANAGSVAGLVTGWSGGTVLGATITLKDKATGAPRTTTSNDAGRYVFANVPPGGYEIAANKTGFRVAKVSQIEITVGTPLTINFSLEVGAMAQTVEGTATRAELQTTNATGGTTIVGDALPMLPNIGPETPT